MTDELSTDELAQMRERAENATPGPWDWTTPPRAELQNPDGVPIVRTATIGWADPPDAEFIARARTDVPRLLDALEAERASKRHWFREWWAEGARRLTAEAERDNAQALAAARAKDEVHAINLAGQAIVRAHADRDRWKAFGEGVLNLVRRSQNDPHFAVVNIDAAGYVGSVIRASDILALANEHKLLND